jgi:exonuclease VII small subunit
VQEAHNEQESHHNAQAERLEESLETLNAAQQDLEGKMAALGAALRQFLDAHKDKSLSALKKELTKVRQKMSKFDAVNQKAGEELGSFLDDEGALQARRKVSFCLFELH